jgi:hypothetical protein
MSRCLPRLTRIMRATGPRARTAGMRSCPAERRICPADRQLTHCAVRAAPAAAPVRYPYVRGVDQPAVLAGSSARRSRVAQLAEHSAVNRRVIGSSPIAGACARLGGWRSLVFLAKWPGQTRVPHPARPLRWGSVNSRSRPRSRLCWLSHHRWLNALQVLFRHPDHDQGDDESEGHNAS